MGPFERGPVSMVFEMHNNLTSPDPCLQAEETVAGWMLHKAWLDDPDIVTFLQTYHNLPAGNATISVDHEETADIDVAAWEWTIDGRTSTMHVLDVGPRESADLTDLRLFWTDGAGAGSLHLDIIVDRPDFANRAAYGFVDEPMLAADRPAYVAHGTQHAGDLTGTFQHWEDMGCERPSWPS